MRDSIGITHSIIQDLCTSDKRRDNVNWQLITLEFWTQLNYEIVENKQEPTELDSQEGLNNKKWINIASGHLQWGLNVILGLKFI